MKRHVDRTRGPTPAPRDGHGVPVTSGSMAVADWLRARGLETRDPRWFVEVILDVVDRPAESQWSGMADSRFHLYLYPSEWSFFFCHNGRASWVRVADRPTMHGRDDFGLVSSTPRLQDIGGFLVSLEERHRIL